MNTSLRSYFDRVWCVDFEYGSGLSGADAPSPRCMVAKELFSDATIRIWLDGVVNPQCPFEFNDRTLYVAFYASAEITNHIALGWPIPTRVIDLFAEYRCLMNGLDRVVTDEHKSLLKTNSRFSPLATMYHFDLATDAVPAIYKKDMQALAIRGGQCTPQEKRALLEYNETDVVALEKLLPQMWPYIELGPALLRGRYMCAVGAVERAGIPLDAELVGRFKNHWTEIVDRLIDAGRDTLDVIKYRDIDRGKFASWLNRNGISSWPHTPAGHLDTSANTLSDCAKIYPAVMQLKEFVYAVRRMKLFADLQVGSDGRNRFLLSPFGSKTGRNTPSNAKSVFGPAAWVRNFIRPEPGHTLIYQDFSGQEYGEAAYFSGDPMMIEDYANDDPYLGFAKRIGLVPENATKKSHGKVRNQLKVAAGLGVLYGAYYDTVARAGNMTPTQARRVLAEHRLTYPQFWKWRESVINHATLYGELRTAFGWKWNVNDTDKSTSISNFVMQASGADMLRIAMCLAVESGIEVVAPVHDALLVHCPTACAKEVEAEVRRCMEVASNAVLGGDAVLKVGTEAIVDSPNRFEDKRGMDAWITLTNILKEMESKHLGHQGSLVSEAELVIPGVSSG